jgi:alpha-1,2-mannosyltransferase
MPVVAVSKQVWLGKGDVRRWGLLGMLVASAAAVTGLLRQGIPHHFLDLLVYRFGSEAAARGPDLYHLRGPSGLPYTYPPFAAFFMWPLTLMPVTVEKQVVLMANVGLAWLLLATCLRAVGGGRPSRPGLVALTTLLLPLVLVLEPIQSTISFGQINLLLAVAIALDLLVIPARYRGILIGTATAIKLTPAIYILYLLMRRQFRQAALAASSAVACTAVGFLLLPALSRDYWLRVVFDSGRIGGQDYTGNQSIWGGMYRLWEPAAPPRVLWVALVAAALATLWWIATHDDAVTPLEGYALAGLSTSLVSPISWTHHLTWVVPLLVVLGAAARERQGLIRPALLVATFAVFAVQLPWQFGKPPGHHWSQGVIGQALESSYVLLMIVVLVAAALTVRRLNRKALPPAVPWYARRDQGARMIAGR